MTGLNDAEKSVCWRRLTDRAGVIIIASFKDHHEVLS